MWHIWHILSEVSPFLGSVFSHWQIWLSGGGILGLIAIIVPQVEKLCGKSLSKRTHVYLFLIAFFLCACFLSWVDKDDALKSEQRGRKEDSAKSQGDYGKLQGDCNSLSSQFQYKSGVVDALASQNRDQQNTINNCQTQAVKLLVPIPLQVVPIAITKDKDVDGKWQDVWVVVVNKRTSPVNLAIQCDQNVSDVRVNVPEDGRGVRYGTRGGEGMSNVALVDLKFPDATPTNPMIVSFRHRLPKANCRMERTE